MSNKHGIAEILSDEYNRKQILFRLISKVVINKLKKSQAKGFYQNMIEVSDYFVKHPGVQKFLLKSANNTIERIVTSYARNQ